VSNVTTLRWLIDLLLVTCRHLRQIYRYLQHESNSSTSCQINFIC
jgi:hypothetical protein